MAVRKKVSKRKIIMFGVSVLVLVASTLIILNALNKKDTKETVKIIDSLSEYGYVLKENTTKYYQDLFKDLKAVLNAEEVDEEAYAKLVAQLFVSDYCTLNNKMSKNDVGGVQFVYEDYQEDFKKYASQTVYRTLINNIDGKREQELPVVKKVAIASFTTTEFGALGGIGYDPKAYLISVDISYEKDLGYTKKAMLVLVHVDDKLVMVEMN